MTTAAAKAPSQEEVAQQEHADFLSEFNNTESAAPAQASATDTGSEDTTTATGDDGKTAGDTTAKAAPGTGAQPAADDPWKDVPPVLKSTLDSITSKIGAIEHMTKSSAGRVGALQSALDEARKTATNKGAPSPSTEQVQAAAANAEEWENLRQEYPEWVSGFEKQMTILEDRILKKVPNVDASAITKDVLDKSTEYARNIGAEVKKVIPLYVKHPEWEETVKTPAFTEWAYTNGPTESERKQKWALEASNPQKATEFVNELIRKYPQWWAERGSLLDSDYPTDAIQVMDKFSEHQKAAQAADQDPPADEIRRQGNKQRLQQAVPATTGAIKPKPATKTEHDEFLEEFNNPN